MRVFISYASQDREVAEQVHYALTAAGHDTFFDRSDIAASADFHQLIHNQIQRADALVFLISRQSVEPGKYTLTELRHAEDQWRHPQGRVLPVLIEPVPLREVPGYLKAVSILEPKGNVASEVTAAVARLTDLQTGSIAVTLKRIFTQSVLECPQFLFKPREYILTRTQREAPLGHALARACVLSLLALIAALSVGAIHRADASSAAFLSLGTLTLWLGYAFFLHVFSWIAGARRGPSYTMIAYLYVMGFLQPVFVAALFLISVVVPDAVAFRTIGLGFGGSAGAGAMITHGRLFSGEATTYFRTVSGFLILIYFAIAMAAAHRIALWRGVLASLLSFVFFAGVFAVLLIADLALGSGIITRLVGG